MSLSTPTPRRGYFVVPTVEPSDALLREDDEDEKRAGPSDSNVPPTPSTLEFVTRSEYRDERTIPRQTIFWSLFIALILVAVIGILGRDIGTMRKGQEEHDDAGRPAHSHSNAATRFPDIHEECHDYYSSAKPMDHRASYFGGGAHDLDTMKQWEIAQEPDVCETSLTYFLTPGVGLFYHLNAIAQAFSMAELAGRSFFIDDSEWDRGKWTDHFQPLPDQRCAKPDVAVVKGCPRAARHWALDPMTLHYHFGHEYQEEFSDPKAAEVWRKKPMYGMSRHAFEEILVPSDATSEIIQLARETLDNATAKTGGLYIGVHLRRGDRHPFSWFYHTSYIPLADFTAAVQQRWEKARLTDTWLPEAPVSYVAAASSNLASEFAATFPQGSQILALSSSSRPSLIQFASKTEYNQSTFAALPASTRLALTRGMMVDFDLLVGGWRFKGEEINRGEGKRHVEEGRKKPIAVACTLSSNVCKMAAVALGWEHAFEEARWLNVDGGDDFDWGPTEVP